MKVLFLSDNFPPEVNAPASRTWEHCEEWVRLGAEVTVITCFPNFPRGRIYEGYRNRWRKVEWINGIKVIRVWSYIAANQGFLKRTLDFISFSLRAFLAGLFVRTEVIVATSPQFFTALAGRALSFWKRKPWIMEVRDLWPESIKAVGAMKDGIFMRYFEWQELRCYRSARRIVCVTEAFRQSIAGRGIDADKIDVVTNGANLDLFQPREKDKDILQKLKLENKHVLGYTGTHGMAHNLEFILDCAKKVLDHEKIHFLFIGDGAERKKLLRKVESEGIINVSMLEPVSKDEISKYLSILDLAIINLKKSELFATVIPSKIFENAAMEIPILLGVDGEARSIVEGYNAGVYYDPDNHQSFIQAMNKMLDPVTHKEFASGCRKLSRDYDRKALAAKMLNIISASR